MNMASVGLSPASPVSTEMRLRSELALEDTALRYCTEKCFLSAHKLISCVKVQLERTAEPTLQSNTIPLPTFAVNWFFTCKDKHWIKEECDWPLRCCCQINCSPEELCSNLPLLAIFFFAGVLFYSQQKTLLQLDLSTKTTVPCRVEPRTEGHYWNSVQLPVPCQANWQILFGAIAHWGNG